MLKISGLGVSYGGLRALEDVSLEVADGEFVIVHSRFSGFGQAKNWVVADFVRVVDGVLVEHWDVVEDEASQAESKSGRPMFGDRFPS